MIDDLTLQEALVRVIRIQQQMILEFEYMRRDTSSLVKVMSNLDPDFAAFFFAMKTLGADPGWNKERIPRWDEMEQALCQLGWSPNLSVDVDWGNSHAWFKQDPWSEEYLKDREVMCEEARKNLRLSGEQVNRAEAQRRET
jgi:hypothetical protein